MELKTVPQYTFNGVHLLVGNGERRPFSNCVTLGQLLNHSVTWFPHLWNGDNDSDPHLLRMIARNKHINAHGGDLEIAWQIAGALMVLLYFLMSDDCIHTAFCICFVVCFVFRFTSSHKNHDIFPFSQFSAFIPSIITLLFFARNFYSICFFPYLTWWC